MSGDVSLSAAQTPQAHLSTGYRFRVLPNVFAVCRLAGDAATPAWALTAKGFVSLTRTEDELSIILVETFVPADVRAERGWRLLKLVGPFDFNAVGVLASLASPLAEAGISLLAIGTFDTDYLLVKTDALERALATLKQAGHEQVD